MTDYQNFCKVSLLSEQCLPLQSEVYHYLDHTLLTINIGWNVQNNGAQQLASEATVYIMLEDVNDEIPLFTEREQETVLEGEPIGTKVTQVNAIDKDGTFPNNQVSLGIIFYNFS